MAQNSSQIDDKHRESKRARQSFEKASVEKKLSGTRDQYRSSAQLLKALVVVRSRLPRCSLIQLLNPLEIVRLMRQLDPSF